MSAGERAAYIAGMRTFMDALEANPQIPLPSDGSLSPIAVHFFGGDEMRAALAETARLLPCDWRKGAWEGDSGVAYFDLTGSIDGVKIKLSAFRDAVCTRTVIGTEEREVEEIVTPAVKRRVTRPVEVVEWTCAPVLADPATERARGAA